MLSIDKGEPGKFFYTIEGLGRVNSKMGASVLILMPVFSY